jgi:hypothetical protein
MSSPVRSSPDQRETHTPVGFIAFAWTLVGVPLVYGLYQTVKTAINLFALPVPEVPQRSGGRGR